MFFADRFNGGKKSAYSLPCASRRFAQQVFFIASRHVDGGCHLSLAVAKIAVGELRGSGCLPQLYLCLCYALHPLKISFGSAMNKLLQFGKLYDTRVGRYFICLQIDPDQTQVNR